MSDKKIRALDEVLHEQLSRAPEASSGFDCRVLARVAAANRRQSLWSAMQPVLASGCVSLVVFLGAAHFGSTSTLPGIVRSPSGQASAETRLDGLEDRQSGYLTLPSRKSVQAGSSDGKGVREGRIADRIA